MCDRFYSLKKVCLHPTSNTPYIISLKGGKDISPEEHQVRNDTSSRLVFRHDVTGKTDPNYCKNGPTHGFVLEFASVVEKEYYVSEDPMHLDFIKSIKAIVMTATIMDFTDREY